MAPALTWINQLSDEQIAAAIALLATAAATDGVDPISEAAYLRLRHRDLRHRDLGHRDLGHQDLGQQSLGQGGSGMHLLAHDGAGTLIGYAGVDERTDRRTAEFAVHPVHRRHGVGGALLAALLDRYAGSQCLGTLWVWAHGEHPAALRLAERAKLVKVRELLQLRRGLADPIPPRALPEEVTLRSFVPGEDEAAVARVNNRAFARHPEQSQWDISALAVRQMQPWFDPKGFLLAVDPQDRLLGFHWTKVQPAGVGEVYVLAVDPDAQGTGLGGALLTAGLEYLRERGLAQVMLYVESDNATALRIYRKLGFVHHHTDVEFLREREYPSDHEDR